ncbi:DUF6670 family protein [Nocardia sp. CA-128927]|uniref:DUF6670 family protein n=1 Tax=Nocardia sp. CA-128927 TaxID=3239975 RepID=UPI003D98AC84
MSEMNAVAHRLVGGLVNHNSRLNGRPFDSGTPMTPPSGRLRNWVHYGVMIPDLPEPHRSFGVMSILGTPGVTVFANDHAITTAPSDTVYTTSAMASMDTDQFFVHSIARDCEFAPDGTHLRFGSDLVIDGSYPHFTVSRTHPDVTAEFEIDATDKVTHFANIPGLYQHWSLLATYRGQIRHRGHHVEAAGLCTFEYATGVGVHSLLPRTRLKIPATFFTYHVLNLDDTTQALLIQVLWPGGFTIQKAVYLRSLTDYGSVHTRGFEFRVREYEPEPRRTPDGRTMRLPQTMSWRVLDRDGQCLIAVEGSASGDFSYGLGAGYVGSYEYTGTYRGRAIAGRAYMEYVDCQ